MSPWTDGSIDTFNNAQNYRYRCRERARIHTPLPNLNALPLYPDFKALLSIPASLTIPEREPEDIAGQISRNEGKGKNTDNGHQQSTFGIFSLALNDTDRVYTQPQRQFGQPCSQLTSGNLS